ncbi:oligosaccharide flippase family protein [Micromonospora sp. C28SCA-DRY-2]|uniref:oligosaccharide flippase family protein n=1 Tax=Micromonospora sp. C28SCA-DRY-2 TaxID=3059522 RepID=UPI00267452A5|nr:oligosaccharide flippase family protein [Micromonospora sp. C28SCA-DRY-2]MDO3704291.1 oligosaccharide flippase family protein [Micromonospora sp. C28SCA-DRY-2]
MSVEERPPPAAERPDLFAKASRALGWSLASTVVNRLSTLAIGVALARILGPDAFGTFAVALVVLLAVLSFNELGVSLAIVRWPGEPREIAPTVATLSVLTSTLVYAGLYLGAPLLARTLGDPGSTAVIRVLGLSVVVSGLVATPVALLQRAFRQDRKTVADLVTNWTSALASIGLALAGNGAMSLAFGQLAGSLAGAALFLVFAPQGLRFGFDPAKARALLRFGLPLAGSSIVVFATTNLDRVVVGATLGPTALGYYVLALQLASWPVTVFSQPVRAVVPAALARLQDDPPALRRSFLSAAGLLGSVTLPACLLLAAAADALIRFLYGDAWQPAAGVLLWLGPLAALRILFELCYDYFVVLADTRVVLTVQVAWFVVLLPALYAAGVLGGLQAAAAVQFAVALLVILPLYLLALRRSGIPSLPVAARLAPPLVGAVAVAAVALLVARVGAVDLVVLAVAGVAALATIGVLGFRLRHVVRDLRTIGQPRAAG